jgi:hypothetical protein
VSKEAAEVKESVGSDGAVVLTAVRLDDARTLTPQSAITTCSNSLRMVKASEVLSARTA